MHHVTPPKNCIRNLIIITIAVGLPIVLTIGLIAHVSLLELLIMGLMTIGIGFFMAGLIGWLFLKFIFSVIQSNEENSLVGTNVRESLAREMTMEYELITDDVLAFYLYNHEYNPQLEHARKLLRRMLLVSSAFEFLVAIILLVVFGEQQLLLAVFIMAFAILTLLWYIFSPSIFRKILKREVTRKYGQSQNKLAGKHKLSITSDAVTDINDMGESKTRWNAIEYVASTDQYLFMLGSDLNPYPYIVPRSTFTDESAFSQFVDTAKTYHQSARAGNSVVPS
ncbi:YcxB family protein [Chloroflexota bacterium]